jgi:D-alanyl-D-alanine dipeptidase
VISSYDIYKYNILADSSKALLEIKKVIPTIVLDIKYATTDNFVHEAVYKTLAAFARKPVVDALIKVQSELARQGQGLKIWDAYRPYSVTVDFWDETHDSGFVSVPWKGSRHNRGCAVDLTLVDLTSGKELDMPTHFDDFTDKAFPNYTKLTERQIANRSMLINIMTKYGFTVYPSEWWHYDFHGWEDYELMDISFEELLTNRNK